MVKIMPEESTQAQMASRPKVRRQYSFHERRHARRKKTIAEELCMAL